MLRMLGNPRLILCMPQSKMGIQAVELGGQLATSPRGRSRSAVTQIRLQPGAHRLIRGTKGMHGHAADQSMKFGFIGSKTGEGLSEMAFEPRSIRRNVRVIGSQT